MMSARTDRGDEAPVDESGSRQDWLAPAGRVRLLKWASWFAVLNAAVMGIVALRYLLRFPFPDDPVAILYVFLAYTGQFTLLAYLPFLLLLLPLALLVPRPKLLVPVAIIVFSAILALLTVDSLLFGRNHFHLSPLTIRILGAGTWGFAALYFAIFAAIEWFLARWTWRRFSPPGRRNRGILLGAFLVLCLTGSQAIYIAADAHYYVPITKFDHYLPLYYRLTAKRFLDRHGLISLNQNRERNLVAGLGQVRGKELNYPVKPLDCDADAPQYNILFIVVDAMRSDFATAEITPAIERFSHRAVNFRNHYSGGNSSRMGMFSLFYGIPGTYWQAFQSLQQPPALMDVIQRRNYRIGVFGSDTLYGPSNLDRTVFARIPNLRMETDTRPDAPYARDIAITEEWLAWLDGVSPTERFFGFLYYAAPTHRYSYPPDYDQAFNSKAESGGKPTLLDRYKSSLRFDDELIGRVLDDLENRGSMEQTIVILTSDHGEEFNDNGLEFQGHGTAYSDYQMHTPMLVHWPGIDHRDVTVRTSHLDVPPTLLARALGCRNPVEEYSTGQDLLTRSDWPWLIAGSYNGYAILEPEQTTVTYVGGYFEVRDRDYRIIEDPVINASVLTEAMNDMGRFFR